jgi:hypothetical protein
VTATSGRDELLDAALRCFVEQGILATGIEDVRKAAGASPRDLFVSRRATRVQERLLRPGELWVPPDRDRAVVAVPPCGEVLIALETTEAREHLANVQPARPPSAHAS